MIPGRRWKRGGGYLEIVHLHFVIVYINIILYIIYIFIFNIINIAIITTLTR